MPESRGTFEVKRTSEPPYENEDGVVLARSRFDKKFQGDLDGTSVVNIIAAGVTAVPSSAGYVAMERVVGTLAGRAGSFVLQHSATMNRGTPSLSITVVPDTGTGALTGIAGRMTIDIVDKKHHYTFEYSLP